MTTQNEASGKPAAWVDEQAVRDFIAGYGPNGQTDDPEMAWTYEIDGWGTPGSADFAHSFETFFYDLQQHGKGLVLADGIGCTYGSTPVLMEVTTDSSGIADCFLIRTTMRAGVQITSGSEELHHLASGEGVSAALDAVHSVARMVSASYRDFVTAAIAFCGNEATTSAVAVPAAELPIGVLACPACASAQLGTIERIPGTCSGEITRDAMGEVRVDCGDQTDVDWNNQVSIGVQCKSGDCGWEYFGADWAEQLVAALEPAVAEK